MNSEKIVNEFGLNIREVRIGLSKICSRNFGRNFICIKEIDGNEVTFMLWNGEEEDSIQEFTFTVNPHDFYATFCSVLEREFPRLSEFKKEVKSLEKDLKGKDEKIEDLINMCASKDEEIQLLEKKYDELKERTASLIKNESDFEFIRAKLDCVISILKDI